MMTLLETDDNNGQTHEGMEGRMDGGTGVIHLPLRPKGFPYHDAEQHTRTMLLTHADIQCGYKRNKPNPSTG